MDMRKILMLDLEGVLIAAEHTPPSKKGINDYGVRPHAKEFVERCFPLFDIVYLNTCIKEKNALEIMKEVFGNETVNYYPWRRNSKERKAEGYEQFLGSLLVHVEDESIECKEAKRIIELGFHYIQVKGWYPHHAWGEKKGEYDNDRELIDALITIEHILK